MLEQLKLANDILTKKKGYKFLIIEVLFTLSLIMLFVSIFLTLGVSSDFFSSKELSNLDFTLTALFAAGPIIILSIGLIIVQFLYSIVKNGLIYEAVTLDKDVKIRGSILRILKRDFFKSALVYLAMIAVSIVVVIFSMFFILIPIFGVLFFFIFIIPFIAISLMPFLVPAATVHKISMIEAWKLAIKKSLFLIVILQSFIMILSVVIPFISILNLYLPFIVIASFSDYADKNIVQEAEYEEV